MKIIKIYEFPRKAKKFWQQEAPFEPPVARTCFATRLFIRKNIKVRNRIVLTVSDFCGCGTRIRTLTNSVRDCRATITQFRNIWESVTIISNLQHLSRGFVKQILPCVKKNMHER